MSLNPSTSDLFLFEQDGGGTIAIGKATIAQLITLIGQNITSGVSSVAGMTGAVTLVAADITDFASAAAADAPVQSVAGRTGAVVLASGDISNFATAAAAAAPVQSVAGRTGAVTIAAADVGGLAAAVAADAPVQSVAGRTGAVVLAETDINGLGSMATQAAGAVAITGGTMASVAITGGSMAGTTQVAPSRVATTTAEAAPTASDFGGTIRIDLAAPAAFTVTLPAGAPIGARVTFKDKARNGATYPGTFAATGTYTIEGGTSYVAASDGYAFTVESDGANNWDIV